MGKTKEPPKTTPASPGDDILIVYPDPATAEELKKRYEPLREWLRQRIEAAERMTPEKRRQADEEGRNSKPPSTKPVGVR
jgi:hypothetical protein